MQVTVTKNSDQKSSKWSGGTTTELWLWPEDGSYAERNFLARISSATVEVAASTFTELSGVRRQIMTLSGDLLLRHEGLEEIRLKPYQVHAFLGDTPTTSEGVVTDFNLMLKDGADGKMSGVALSGNQEPHLLHLDASKQGGFHLLYCAKGVCNYETSEESGVLLTGDSLKIWLSERETTTLKLSSEKDSYLAMASVQVNR